ncbi:SDR family NAD(P)-dependent oxidoreductase [Nakamurella flavida]|uniref:Probable oxidoreductase n=1 Tax=Nakamurella flavida TaxID=363630 RepID=A0A939C797_9ACTN|nr:SDR family NAD(P)-dependent oxidoreductase [Nakamurella flavida]MBM9477947.1 SDR family NAD(P)-dependent oxidoreductase [Nakamurella flavida]MDP9778337.1 NAD(P)-dependent dehydrogenase (short-subunit alcohol dehydrogenase family) [Nakamurella flavida]
MTRIRSEFSSRSTALQVVDGVDLAGRRAVVTGAASGIGVETARALAHAGAQVTLAVRDTAAGERVAADIADSSGRTDLVVAHLDLADLASVDAFTRAWQGPLHILVNNAGVMDSPQGRTAQGWETQFGTNYLGHFALATGLHGALAAAGDARIVAVSSSGHAASPVVLDDLFFDRRPYDPNLAYGQSKTADALFAVEASRRWAADGITANSLDPGGIWTPLQRHWSPERRAAAEEQARGAAAAGLFHMKSTEQGAATSVFLATSPLVAGIGGRYFQDCQEAEVVSELNGLDGVLPHALDPQAARQLWDVSEQLITRARTTA